MNKNKAEFFCLKLKTGETLFSEIWDGDEEITTLHCPMLVLSKIEGTAESMTLAPWIPFVDDNLVKIPTSVLYYSGILTKHYVEIYGQVVIQSEISKIKQKFFSEHPHEPDFNSINELLNRLKATSTELSAKFDLEEPSFKDFEKALEKYKENISYHYEVYTMTEEVKKLKPKEKPHYVSNPILYQAYCDWHIAILDSIKKGKEPPEMPRHIAESIIKICTRLSYRPNFINYSFKEEMVGDAIENCFRTAKNFNPEKSINPFSFITTIAFNAFLRRIAAEQKQTYVKSKLIEELPLDELMDMQEHDEDTMQQHNQFIEFLRENSYISQATEPGRKKKKKILDEEIGLEEFFDGEVTPNEKEEE